MAKKIPIKDGEGNLAYVGDYSGFGSVIRYHYSLSGKLAMEDDTVESHTKYTYDVENRLTSIDKKDGDVIFTSRYAYDADDREVQTTTIGGKHLSRFMMLLDVLSVKHWIHLHHLRQHIHIVQQQMVQQHL